MTSTTTTPGTGPVVTPRAWTMLAIGIGAQVAGTVFVTLPAVLIPYLSTTRGLSLAQGGTLAGAATLGMVLTLVAWGALADRHGERLVLAGGLALTALCALGAILTDGTAWLTVLLLLGGAGAASANAASGRVVLGWFPRERRGLAMGVRQVSQPLGVTVAALTVPPLAAGHGLGAALALPLALTTLLCVACLVGIVDPPRPGHEPVPAAAAPPPTGAPAPGAPPAAASSTNPYRHSSFLWRVHAVSALLVVPQYTLTTFGLVWLMGHGALSTGAAGLVLGLSQFVGAAGRVVIGVASDHVGSRVLLLRRVSAAGVVVMLLLAACDAMSWRWVGVVLYVIATTVSVADNGLAYTSVAEGAGPRWAGRALGTQNTAQYVAASAVGPVVGALLGVVAYPVAFTVVALAPLVALPVVPRHDADAVAPVAG